MSYNKVTVGEILTTKNLPNFLTNENNETVLLDKTARLQKYSVSSIKADTGSISLTFASSASTITRSTGSFVSNGFAIGDDIIVVGTTSNDGKYTIANVTALVITVTGTLINETATCTLQSGITEVAELAGAVTVSGVATATNQTNGSQKTQIVNASNVNMVLPTALGQTTKSGSLPITVASDQGALDVSGTRANSGSDTTSGKTHLTVGGSDGTNLRPLTVDTAGKAVVKTGVLTEVTGTASSATTVLSQDITSFRSVSVQITGTFSASVIFELSNDNSNWVQTFATQSTSTGFLTSTVTSAGLFYMNTLAKYFRIRVSSYASGTVTATAEFSDTTSPLQALTVDTELANVTLADGASNPTIPQVGSYLSIYNGTTWDRLADVARTHNTTGTGLLASGNVLYGGASYYRQVSVLGAGPSSFSAAGIAAMGASAHNSANNAPSTARFTNLTNTAQSIKASSGNFYGLNVINTTASIAYIKLYNTASGSVTVGTTAVVNTYQIPASGSLLIEPNSMPLQFFSTAISVACTTGSADSDTTAPASNLIAVFKYA